MWYNWVSEFPHQATSIAIFGNDGDGEGYSFFILMFWSCHTLWATCTWEGPWDFWEGLKCKWLSPWREMVSGWQRCQCGRGGRITVGPLTCLSKSLFPCFSSLLESGVPPSSGIPSLHFAFSDWDLVQLWYFFLPLDLKTWHLCLWGRKTAVLKTKPIP